MNSPDRFLLVAAAIAGATGVAIGAFGAHGLEGFLQSRGLDADLIAKRLGQFDTGARYHLVHAVALLALSALIAPGQIVRSQIGSTRMTRAGYLFLVGIVLFSGSLYLLVLTGITMLGAITPLGGIAWIIAWSLLAFSVLGAERPA